MSENVSLEDELNAIMKDASVDPSASENEVAKVEKESTETTETEVSAPEATEESPKEAPKEEPEQTDPYAEPPKSLSAKVREKWKTLDPEIRADLVKREEDVHKMFTRGDGELNLGRKMKEIISPYAEMIHREGGTPETAVKSLLETAALLRTSSKEQKAEIIKHIAMQYDVDLGLVGRVTPQENELAAMRRELQALRQNANPEVIKRQLQDDIEYDKINSEVRAFASDSANKYFEEVRPFMSALMSSGQCATLKEAYDVACRANNKIFNEMQNAQKIEAESKKRASVDVKRAAAKSVTGSGSGSTSAKMTLEEDLRTLLSPS